MTTTSTMTMMMILRVGSLSGSIPMLPAGPSATVVAIVVVKVQSSLKFDGAESVRVSAASEDMDREENICVLIVEAPVELSASEGFAVAVRATVGESEVMFLLAVDGFPPVIETESNTEERVCVIDVVDVAVREFVATASTVVSAFVTVVVVVVVGVTVIAVPGLGAVVAVRGDDAGLIDDGQEVRLVGVAIIGVVECVKVVAARLVED